MPWNWNVNEIGPRMDIYNGGSRGSVKESKVAAAWPEYEANYLKTRLMTGQGKWDATNMTDAQQAVYLQEVAKNHQDEADECLKRDFKLWLEGRHPTYNDPNRVFNNEGRDGLPERRHVYRTSDDANAVTTPMDNWRSTPWGTDQLTHLPGVRDFLRDEFEHGEEQTLYMNLLAEHGPQTLEEAWMYFKHWVAERPLSEAQCLTGNAELGNKALFGSMPHHMQNEGARAARPGGGAAPPRARGFTNFGSGTASAGPAPMDTSAPTEPKVKSEPTTRERRTGPRQDDIEELQGTSKEIAREQAVARAANARRNFINQARKLAEAEMRGQESAAQLRADLAQANEYWKAAQRAAAESQDATRFAEASAAARAQQDLEMRRFSSRNAVTGQRAAQLRAQAEQAAAEANEPRYDRVRMPIRPSDVVGASRTVRARSPGRRRAQEEEVEELTRQFERAYRDESSRRVAREGPNPANPENQMR